MSDEAPPTYLRDFKLCRSWREKLFQDIGLPKTHRSRLIFNSACVTVAFGYEANRNDEARYEILKRHVQDTIKRGGWEHIKY